MDFGMLSQQGEMQMSNVTNLAVARDNRRQQEKPKSVGKGFALLHRKIQETEFYRKDSQAVHLWVHLIMSANHAEASVSTEYGEILLKRGQFITGRNTLVSETGIEANRIQYLLKKFKKMGMISTASPGKFTVVNIEKYDEYQGDFVPEDSQKIPRENPGIARLAERIAPEDSQKIPTNNNTNNNLISKDIKCATQSAKQRLSCEEVWQCLKEELPEARGWRTLTDERRNLIRNFWAKANKIARDLDNGQTLTMDGFRSYLKYISRNCRWMLEDRPDQRTGQTWRRKKFDDFLKAKLYVEVREGDRDDR